MIQALLIALLLQRGAPPSPGGVVAGRITFSDGTPVVGELVLAVPAMQPGQTPPAPAPAARSDAAGNFRMPRVPPGRYILRAGSLASSAIYYPGVALESAATVLNVVLGAPLDNLQFTLPASASVKVTGKVVFPSNYAAAPNRPVVQVSGLPQAVTIAADGTFEIAHLRPGGYSLTVAPAPGMQPVRITVADRDLENIELIVPRLIDIAGTVVSDDRTRPAFILGLVGSTAAQPTPASVANGTFSARVPAGEYRVIAQGVPAGHYFKSMTAGSVNLLTTPLKAGGTEAIRVTITLGVSSGVHVKGHLKSSPAERADAASRKISLADPIQNNATEVAVAPDGTFEFERLMPGTYFTRVMLNSSLGTPFGTVVVPEKDVADLEIAAPELKEISGRIAVDGNGTPPRFNLLLAHGADSLMTPANSPSELPVIVATAQNAVRLGAPDMQILQLDVNALSDGTFKIKVPEGTYRVAALPNQPNQRGIPPAFFLRTLSYGPARLLTEHLTIKAEDTDQLFIGFGTSTPNPWVKVAGRVVGASLSQGGYRVELSGNTTSPIEANVDAEGKFEFPRVLQSTTYEARLLPTRESVPIARVTIADKDVSGVEIVVPAEREITIRTTVEGNAPVPTFSISLSTATPGFPAFRNAMNVLVKPESDGTFKAKLPDDERRVSLEGLPLGYDVKAITYGSTDLRKQSLKISGSSFSEIRIELALDPNLPMGSVRGRVKGLDPNSGSVRIVLNGAASYSSFEEAVNADGSFNFSKIPQGSYAPSLKGAVTASRLTPAIITVTGSDLAGIEIEAPPKTANLGSPPVDEPPTGARISDLSGSGREPANESAAVANLRTLNTALVTYLSVSAGNYGGLEAMISAGLLDARFRNPVSGFHYTVIAVGPDYAAVAIPVGQQTGRYGYFSAPDAVIRYSAFDGLAPPGQAGKPVQ